MSKLLIAISSCQLYEDKGWHAAMRETWLAEAKRLGVDYKFFFGRTAREKDDVVIVNSDDAYFDLTNKQKEKIKWATLQGYEYMFSCFADTYASVERLLASGYENYDYFGDVFCHPNGTPYCQGGPGYFLSRKAFDILNKATCSYPNEDCWVGDMLAGKDIKTKDSKDFVWLGHLPGMGPSKSNTHISAHLSNAEGGYRPELMYEKHLQWTQNGPQK